MQDYNIFPNPCSGSFIIQSKVELEIKSVELISLNGQIHKLISNDQGMYYISNKPAGIYFIKISDMLNTRYIKLIIL
ncbi:MAG: T9SS type A sorting domain-containing protein [Saprospiraceae bacterium]|nr:T9SS type A sorting domain-containing protein [Saprospiraceae bacterium]